MIEVFLGVCIAVAIFAMWALWCNERTLQQRLHILHSIGVGDPNFWALHEDWSRVSYNRHLWTLIFFGDPRRLYSPELLDVAHLSGIPRDERLTTTD